MPAMSASLSRHPLRRRRRAGSADVPTAAERSDRTSRPRRHRSAAGSVIVSAVIATYPRRQQLRRLRRAASRGALAAVALVAAVLTAAVGEPAWSLVLVVMAGVLALASRSCPPYGRPEPGRRSVGDAGAARARAARARRLAVRHAVDWPGRGDLDHVVRAPTGIGFVIETKTLRWTRAHRGAHERRGTLAGAATPPIPARRGGRAVRHARATR